MFPARNIDSKMKTIYEQLKPLIKQRRGSKTKTVHYSIMCEDFPDEFKRIAEKELNESEENRKEGLRLLRDVMAGEKTSLEDCVLLAVLRNCKFDFKKSESKLRSFLAKRREIIRMLGEISAEKIENILDDFGFGVLPYRDKYGRLMIYTRPHGFNVEKYDAEHVGVVIAATILFFLRQPITSVTGYAYFGECKSPSLFRIYPALKSLKKVIPFLLCFPARISRIEVVNENKVCLCFMKAVSPFLGKKVRERITLHGAGYDKLHKLYGPEILPEEFGGNLGPLSNTVYKQKLLDFIQELKNESG